MGYFMDIPWYIVKHMMYVFLDFCPEGIGCLFVPYSRRHDSLLGIFNAPELSSGEPKDASAAAITASALLELSTYINNSDSASFYRNKAVEMLQILSSPAYQARNKKDAFLLHSVGHMNKGWEVDASISYADYYYFGSIGTIETFERENNLFLANL